MTSATQRPTHRPCRLWPGARVSLFLRNLTAQTVITVCAVLALEVGETFAQPDTLWVKTYGIAGGEYLSNAVHSQNGGYLLGGYHAYYQNLIPLA